MDENGAVVILKNNKLRYVLTEYGELDKEERVDDREIEDVAKNNLFRHMKAFKELAK